MRRLRIAILPLLACAVALTAAAPALAGGVAEVDGETLRYTGDALEPNNVTISLDGNVLLVDENGSRITPGAGCTVSDDGYHAACDATGVERISVVTSPVGSDVRIKAALPAQIEGGPGDDLLIGGPGDDVIRGGGGQDILGGGGGSDELHGGPDRDLVTYVDRIARDGTLLPRREGVRVQVGRLNWSGAGDERDTIADDVEEVEGGAGNDRFEARDGRRLSIACGAGRDVVVSDPLDDTAFDCEVERVAPPRGGRKMTIPTLAFPFPRTVDVGRSEVRVGPVLPLRRNTVMVRVTCPVGVGLIALVEGQSCAGTLRFARGGTVIGNQRVRVGRGKTITVKLPLTASRALARRPGGLPLTVTALPNRGDVKRVMRFTVKG